MAPCRVKSNQSKINILIYSQAKSLVFLFTERKVKRMSEIVISDIQVVPIKPQNGLVCFSTCVINSQFFVGNIAVYTSPLAKNGFRLVFPNKKLASGQTVDCFHPISKEAEEKVTAAITKRYLELMGSLM